MGLLCPKNPESLLAEHLHIVVGQNGGCVVIAAWEAINHVVQSRVDSLPEINLL